MNLSKVIIPQVHIQDSCLFEFSDETGVSVESIVAEANQYLPTDTIRRFLADYSSGHDIECDACDCIEQYMLENSVSATDILEFLNQWLDEDTKQEMMESFRKSWDLD